MKQFFFLGHKAPQFSFHEYFILIFRIFLRYIFIWVFGRYNMNITIILRDSRIKKPIYHYYNNILTDLRTVTMLLFLFVES